MGLLERMTRGVRPPALKRDVQPLEGTNISLFNTFIPSWWAENGLLSSSQWMPGDGRLAERVWIASRCVQMNSQQIASMPLRFEGTTEPAWVTAPDLSWFPNGITDAVFCMVSQLYAWGFVCGYITDYYADGYPRTWTVLDSSVMNIKIRDGERVYKFGEKELDASRVFQIDRNPGIALHGTSALCAYAQQAWGLLAAGNQSMNVSQGGVPLSVLKSQRKLTQEQAQEIQTQWMDAVSRRNGAPPVLPPELDFTPLQFSPADLALLDTQEWNAKMIASAFGVPAVLLNMAIDHGMTYQNPAALGEMWWRFELRTTAKRIADAMTAQLLPSGQWVWFDATDTFLPLDPSSEQDDPQAATPPGAKASPAQQPPAPALTAIGGNG